MAGVKREYALSYYCSCSVLQSSSEITAFLCRDDPRDPHAIIVLLSLT